jgi:hypothetical protein
MLGKSSLVIFNLLLVIAAALRTGFRGPPTASLGNAPSPMTAAKAAAIANATTGSTIAAAAAALGTARQNVSLYPMSMGYSVRPPRVYFLFLAVDKVANLDVWNQFFLGAPRDQYRAFVHCKTEQCRAQVAQSPLVAIPDVPTVYCSDLVSAMNQLVVQAMLLDAGASNAQDQFTFVSDSTLPAKPFDMVYHSLTTRTGSSLCLFPTAEWADIATLNGVEVAPKYFQWITLNRAHAEQTRLFWASGRDRNLMEHFHMNKEVYMWTNNTFSDHRNFGCLDEFWYFAVLFNTIHEVYPDQNRVIDFHSLEGSPIQVHSEQRWQGRCDTFVLWHKHIQAPGPGDSMAFSAFYVALDHSSTPNSGNSARPGWWTQMSTNGMHAVRNSDFLFIRKVYDKPVVTDGTDFARTYSSIVLS